MSSLQICTYNISIPWLSAEVGISWVMLLLLWSRHLSVNVSSHHRQLFSWNSLFKPTTRKDESSALLALCVMGNNGWFAMIYMRVWYKMYANFILGPVSIWICRLTSIGIPIINIRLSYGHLIFIMKISNLEIPSLYQDRALYSTRTI